MAGWISVIDVLTHSVTHTIPVGTDPKGAAVLPNGAKLMLRTVASPGITIIDTSSNSVEKIIPFGHECLRVLQLIQTVRRYTLQTMTEIRLRVIDTASETISQTMTVGEGPGGITVHPDGTKVYVANDMRQNISVIDTSSNNVIDTISLPGNPVHVAFNPSGTRAYVTSWETSSVWVIDTASRTVIADIDVGATDGAGVDVSPDGAFVYVATTANLTDFALNPNGTKAYVASWKNDLFCCQYCLWHGLNYCCRPNSYSGGIDFTPDGAYVYVTVCDYDYDKEKEINCVGKGD